MSYNGDGDGFVSGALDFKAKKEYPANGAWDKYDVFETIFYQYRYKYSADINSSGAKATFQKGKISINPTKIYLNCNGAGQLYWKDFLTDEWGEVNLAVKAEGYANIAYKDELDLNGNFTLKVTHDLSLLPNFDLDNYKFSW